MAVITAAMVKELRVKTDAPMMECKKALTEADGNMEQAEEILRVKLGNRIREKSHYWKSESRIQQNLKHYLYEKINRILRRTCIKHDNTPWAKY